MEQLRGWPFGWQGVVRHTGNVPLSKNVKSIMNGLMALADANALIAAGKKLHIAGDEAALRQLGRGIWIGGTIPYFLTSDGGVVEREKVFVTQLPDAVTQATTGLVDIGHIPAITTEAPRNGFSIVIVPGMSEIHTTYALTASSVPGIYDIPIIGWISGIHLDDIGKTTPKVFDGATGETAYNRIAVMHATLAGGKAASIGTINLFKPGSGDDIVFRQHSFTAGECTINGRPDDFYDYVTRKRLDTTLPLITELAGKHINVSFQSIDAGSRTVAFYAPVMKNRVYRQAEPLPDYRAALIGATEKLNLSPFFSCNCILNYLYGRLEGNQSIPLPGPATFGELAHVLMNQTLVYLSLTDKTSPRAAHRS
jgi:hypothetical protein